MLILTVIDATSKLSNIFLMLSWRWCLLMYQSCYAMAESLLWSRAVSTKLFFEFENDFTEPSVPTCLPCMWMGGMGWRFMSKNSLLLFYDNRANHNLVPSLAPKKKKPVAPWRPNPNFISAPIEPRSTRPIRKFSLNNGNLFFRERAMRKASKYLPAW
jgi:hypothetical protein